MNEFNEKDLKNVTGGKRNSDGTYSFTKGQKFYEEYMRYHIYEVLENYSNVPGNTTISVNYFSTISDENLGKTTVSASKLHECSFNGVVR